MNLEEKRDQREKERMEKEEEKIFKMSTGKEVKSSIFKGITGERPEAHILRATDWMETSNATMDDAMKIKNFRLTVAPSC